MLQTTFHSLRIVFIFSVTTVGGSGWPSPGLSVGMGNEFVLCLCAALSKCRAFAIPLLLVPTRPWGAPGAYRGTSWQMLSPWAANVVHGHHFSQQ